MAPPFNSRFDSRFGGAADAHGVVVARSLCRAHARARTYTHVRARGVVLSRATLGGPTRGVSLRRSRRSTVEYLYELVERRDLAMFRSVNASSPNPWVAESKLLILEIEDSGEGSR